MSIGVVREALSALGLQPRRALGQNFLVDEHIRDQILDAAGLCADDSVVEVGPGLGALTEALVTRVARVRAVERDPRLHAWLGARLASATGLELLHGDAVELDFDRLGAEGFDVLVSNLPYSAGTRILMNACIAVRPPRRMVVTVQKEVADRMAAPPATRAFGLSSLWAQAVYGVERLRRVTRGCFHPRPDVESTVVRFERLEPAPVSAAARPALHQLSKVVFAHRRKQLHVSLRSASREGGVTADAWLVQAGIDPAARPEELTMAQWARLAEAATGRADPDA